ncbi:hypothetical protein ABWH98_06230 [Labrenzia sp. ac12]
MSAKSEKWFGILMVALFLIPVLVVGFVFFMGLFPYIYIGIGFSSWSGGERNYVNQGNFYRITIEYIVDDVEPLSFNLVAACGYDDFEGATYLDRVLPALYGKTTRDNHAVVVKIPDFCSEVSARTLGKAGGGDGSFLPFTMWFDDANDMAVGLGYSSIFAFQNSAARLSFVSSRVRYATREEFEDWYEYNNNNLLSPKSFRVAKEQRAERKSIFPDHCFGIGFAHGNDQVQSLLEAYWPEDHPKYWSRLQVGDENWRELNSELWGSEVAQFQMYNLVGIRAKDMIGHADWSASNARRGYSSLNLSKLSQYFLFREKPTEQYPVYFYRVTSGMKNIPSDSKVSAKVDLTPELKGFVSCYASQLLPLPKVYESAESELTNKPTHHAPVFLVDVNGEFILSLKNRHSFSDYIIVEDLSIGKLIDFSIAHSTWVY